MFFPQYPFMNNKQWSLKLNHFHRLLNFFKYQFNLRFVFFFLKINWGFSFFSFLFFFQTQITVKWPFFSFLKEEVRKQCQWQEVIHWNENYIRVQVELYNFYIELKKWLTPPLPPPPTTTKNGIFFYGFNLKLP